MSSHIIFIIFIITIFFTTSYARGEKIFLSHCGSLRCSTVDKESFCSTICDDGFIYSFKAHHIDAREDKNKRVINEN